MKRLLNIIKKLIIITIIGAIVGFSYSYYEARNIRLVEYTFAHSDIPNSFTGKKIVYIADTHCNQYFTPNDMAELVVRVNNLNPDIIVLGGDYTDANAIYSKPFFEEIKKLKAKDGIYSVFGNHDYWESIDVIRHGIKECGFNICDNQSYWIYSGSDSIKIGGVGDIWEDEQLLDKTTHDISDEQFCILLSHNPDFAEKLTADSKIDLMLSGHTHGGQVTILGLYAPIMPVHWRPELGNTGQKYRYGWKDVGNTRLYVTTGVGMGNFPFRFFARPEIVEITLRNK